MKYLSNSRISIVVHASDVFYKRNALENQRVELKVGNTVHLRSDDLLDMTIIGFELDENNNCESATVVWFDDYKQLHEAVLPIGSFIVKSDVVSHSIYKD